MLRINKKEGQITLGVAVRIKRSGALKKRKRKIKSHVTNYSSYRV